MKAKIFGRSIPILAIVAIVASAGMVSAALLSYYGKITTTAKVQQSVLVDGKNYLNPIVESISTFSGNTVVKTHSLTNRSEVPATVKLVTSYSAVNNNGNEMNSEGVTTTYWMETSGISIDDEFLYMSFDVEEEEETFLLVYMDTKEGGLSWVDPHGVEKWTDYEIVDPWAVSYAYGEEWYLGKWFPVPEEEPYGWSEPEEWLCEGFVGEESRTEGRTHYNFRIPLADIEFDAGYGLDILVHTGAGVGDWFDAFVTIPYDTIILQPGETVNFYIRYSSVTSTEPGIYTITTTVEPVV